MLNYKNLFTRILSGIVYIAILMLGILINQNVFVLIFSLLLIVSLHEFFSITNKEHKSYSLLVIDIFGGLSLFIGSFLYFSQIVSFPLVLVPSMIYLIVRFTYQLYQKNQNPIQSLAYSFLAQIYLSVPFSIINALVFISPNAKLDYNYTFILALFIFIWVNDSFAYLVGSLLGKNKMFERISPKKSWEGFFGGVTFAIAASIIYSFYYTEISLIEWIGFAIVTVVFGTLGDLIESLFKRTLKVKDSGNIIPGHGGILDRLDSFIFALPAQFVYLTILFFLI